jgi:hypothetical protein
MKYDFIDRNKLTDIANSIREKNGEEDLYRLDEMPEKILDLSSFKLTDLYVKTPPNKLVYEKGELFDSTGMEVIAVLNNKWAAIIDNFTVSPEIIDRNGDITISFTFNGDILTCKTTCYIKSIYGAIFDGTGDTSKWTRIDDSADFEDPIAYMDGIDNYGSPFDTLWPWAGIKRVTDNDAGELVAIPKFWYKWTRTSSTF